MIRSALLVTMVLGAAACEREPFGTPQNITTPPPLWRRAHIEIRDNFFNPVPLTVTQHTRIFWTNKDVEAHTVTFDEPVSFDSGWLSPNQETNRQMNAIGKFSYRCLIHPNMKGTVQVIPRTVLPSL